MKFSYQLSLQDLVQLEIRLIQRRVGMSLFLLHFCGMTLGPLGIILTVFCLLNWRSVIQVSWANVFGLFFWPLCIFYGASSFHNASWNLRRRLARCAQADPRLTGKRTLSLVNTGIIETDYDALDGKHYFHCWGWNSLEKVEDERSYITLYRKSGEIILVPKASADSPAVIQALLETILGFWHSAKTGTPAPSKEGVWPPAPRAGHSQELGETPKH